MRRYKVIALAAMIKYKKYCTLYDPLAGDNLFVCKLKLSMLLIYEVFFRIALRLIPT